MTAFDGLRESWEPRRARRARRVLDGWRDAWRILGPVLPLALAAGLIIGTAIAVVVWK